MKISEIFDSGGFKKQVFNNELYAFTSHLRDDKDRILSHLEHNETAIADLFTVLPASHPDYERMGRDSGMALVHLSISGDLGDPELNMNDLYDGDEKVTDIVHGGYEKKMSLIRQGVRSLLNSWERYGLMYVTPTASQEKIKVGKFDVNTHINYEDVKYGGVRPETADIDETLVLWFKWPLVDGVYEAQNLEDKNLFSQILDVGKTVLDPEDSLYDAIMEGTYSDLETGFFYFFDYETNFVGFNLGDLFDGDRETKRELNNKIANAKDPKFDNNKWMKFTHNFERLLYGWQRLGLQSISVKSDKKKPFRSTDLKFQGDFFLYVVFSIDPKTKKLNLKFTARFPAQK